MTADEVREPTRIAHLRGGEVGEADEVACHRIGHDFGGVGIAPEMPASTTFPNEALRT